MARRVVMDGSGLRISKPGVDVLTTDANGLLFDSSAETLQIVASGVRSTLGGISWPAMGFAPFVYLYTPNGQALFEYTSNNSANILGGTGSGPYYWAVLSIPRLY